jgi:hypothetical protein
VRLIQPQLFVAQHLYILVYPYVQVHQQPRLVLLDPPFYMNIVKDIEIKR